VDVLIIGGSIGGLTLGLLLYRAGIASRIYESTPDIKPLGVGINILPHAAKELCELGLEDDLVRFGIRTREAVFYNRYGQLIYSEPLGRHAGYVYPQFSIHRGDLQMVLLDAYRKRAGADRVFAGWRCIGFDQNSSGATAYFRDSISRAELEPQRGTVVIGCDGLHSVIREQLHPDEGAPLYSGVNMWRGVTPWTPFLTGASMVRAGWHLGGKMVIYPIRNNVDTQGRQLVNWVAEIATPRYKSRDWNRPGELDDFIDAFGDWHFEWLDVPAMIRSTQQILEFPMIDQEPLPWWSRGRVALLGDAAHPMYPRGSNGAGQAIVDARALTDRLSKHRDPVEALKAYEVERLEATASIVRMNRKNPPDAILREVFERTGDKPFDQLDDVITQQELRAISDRYKQITAGSRRAI
jgi:2-polyprenyl-6-methoxyphenol hydroxylase-like FAD-dependent oxidoreductase